jgi:hypothetical protein
MDTDRSLRAGSFLASLVRDVDPQTRLISIGDVEDGYFILLGRRSRLAGGCTVETMTVARAIAGDDDAQEAILANFRRCLDSFAA